MVPTGSWHCTSDDAAPLASPVVPAEPVTGELPPPTSTVEQAASPIIAIATARLPCDLMLSSSPRRILPTPSFASGGHPTYAPAGNAHTRLSEFARRSLFRSEPAGP